MFETEHLSSCATGLMVDVSHSMVLYGEDRITPAKKIEEAAQCRRKRITITTFMLATDAPLLDFRKLTALNRAHLRNRPRERGRLRVPRLREEPAEAVALKGGDLGRRGCNPGPA